mgnify:CR=1 FL=1
MVLITLHFNRTVTSDCLMMIARNCVVESVDADVEDTVVKGSVLVNDLIHRTRRVCCGEILLCHEMIFVVVV